MCTNPKSWESAGILKQHVDKKDEKDEITFKLKINVVEKLVVGAKKENSDEMFASAHR